MRPCRVERLEPGAAYLLGLALIRGHTVPVVDAGVLSGGSAEPALRFVILRVGERQVALAVPEVIGVRALDERELEGLPPLLAGQADLLRAVAVLDGALVQVLECGRIVRLAADHVEASC